MSAKPELSPSYTVIKRIALFLAVAAMLLPAIAAEAPLRAQTGPIDMGPVDTGQANTSAEPERQHPELGLEGVVTPPFRMLQDGRRGEVLGQVNIRQRVIIRISPSTPDARQRMMAALPRRSSQRAFEEVPHDDCVEVDDIIGVQPTQDNRLLLFMGNRNILAAELERSCSARAFYSGFYVERSEDGRLCIGRDQLQSRAGASCEVAGITRLVAVGN